LNMVRSSMPIGILLRKVLSDPSEAQQRDLRMYVESRHLSITLVFNNCMQ
jgi:hypothetical protein